MKVNKCDRCGAIFGDNSDFPSDGLVGWLREKGKVDFCDNCIESFFQWFRTGKKNDIKEEKPTCRNCGNYNQPYSPCGDCFGKSKWCPCALDQHSCGNCKYFDNSRHELFDNQHCEHCIVTDPNGIVSFTHFEHKREGWI